MSKLPIDIAVLSTINASIKDPVTVPELLRWLQGRAPVTPGKGTFAVYTFFIEVPEPIQHEFASFYNISSRQLADIADKHVRHRVAEGRLERGRSR